jgi:hypothetical protein
MRTEHALMVEEMQSWDRDPIWLAYEEEANKLVWDINQKCVSALNGAFRPCLSAVSEVRFAYNLPVLDPYVFIIEKIKSTRARDRCAVFSFLRGLFLPLKYLFLKIFYHWPCFNRTIRITHYAPFHSFFIP